MPTTNSTERTIKICYEWMDETETRAPQKVSPEGFTRQEAIVGGFVGVLLHEVGHAVNDLLNLPVLGREEDSADQIAGFIMLQFGKDVARIAIKGTAYSLADVCAPIKAGLLGHPFDAGAALLQFPLHRLWRRPADLQGPRRQMVEQGPRRDAASTNTSRSATLSPRPSCRTSTRSS